MSERRVSITFFVAAMRALIRQYGDRLLCQENTNQLIEIFGRAEALWQASPKTEPAARKKVRSAG